MCPLPFAVEANSWQHGAQISDFRVLVGVPTLSQDGSLDIYILMLKLALIAFDIQDWMPTLEVVVQIRLFVTGVRNGVFNTLVDDLKALRGLCK